MSSLIQRIVRQAKIAFLRQSCNDQEVANLQKLVSQLTAEDVGINENTFRRLPHYDAPVLSISVYEHDDFAVTIFVLKQGCRIPLHNHPGMTGILKVLYGSVRIESFSPTSATTTPTLSLSYVFGRNRSGVHAIRHDPVVVSPRDEPCRLSPNKGNIHEVRADQGGPVAFLDVLSPPYGSGSRDCTYYSVASSGSMTDAGERCVLQVVPVPKDFWCDTFPYEGPRLGGHIDDGAEN